MSSKQRSEVWRGIRKKTSGGLTKADLIKNKRGKLVSKKKSSQAGSQNNLGSWLREKGKKVDKSEMLRKKSAPPADAPKSKQAAPKKAAPKAAAKPKSGPKAPPKPSPAPKPKKQPAVVQKKAQAKPKRKKVKKQPGINPVTQQPYEKKSKSGYVEGAKVSLDNLKRRKMKPKKKAVIDYGTGGW